MFAWRRAIATISRMAITSTNCGYDDNYDCYYDDCNDYFDYNYRNYDNDYHYDHDNDHNLVEKIVVKEHPHCVLETCIVPKELYEDKGMIGTLREKRRQARRLPLAKQRRVHKGPPAKRGGRHKIGGLVQWLDFL